MARFRFSRLAETDLMDIFIDSLRTWGEEQAVRYVEGLEASCRQLANNPELGRACDDIRPGLRRMEHGQHVIFYRTDERGILVSRVLHRRMLPQRHGINQGEQR